MIKYLVLDCPFNRENYPSLVGKKLEQSAPLCLVRRSAGTSSVERKRMAILKGCGCDACRAGRRHPRGKAQVKKASRSFKRQGKAALQKGQEPITKIGIGYTD